jgi:hypothetical protein
MPNAKVGFAVDVCFLVIFVELTFAFGNGPNVANRQFDAFSLRGRDTANTSA